MVHSRASWVIVAAVSCALVGAVSDAAVPQPEVRVDTCQTHDVSPPLADMKPLPPLTIKGTATLDRTSFKIGEPYDAANKYAPLNEVAPLQLVEEAAQRVAGVLVGEELREAERLLPLPVLQEHHRTLGGGVQDQTGDLTTMLEEAARRGLGRPVARQTRWRSQARSARRRRPAGRSRFRWQG